MPRYIDADLIVERCQRQEKDEWNKKAAPISWVDAYEQFETDISCIPTEDVVPVVHAHWVSVESKSVGWSVGWDNETFGCPESTCYCSHCGEWLTASDEYHVIGKYCPNCGANMGFVNGQTGGKKDGWIKIVP